MSMSLSEKKISPRLSLYPESYRAARLNMIFGVMLWAGFIMISAIIDSGISSASDFMSDLKTFITLTFIGVIVSIIPTIIGAKVLSVWLQRNNVTQKSAMIAGAVTGTTAISLLTFPISMIWFDIDYSFQSIILLFARFHLPIAICAALTGGRTGLQLAKFIEAQDQNPAESEQDILTTTQS